jgi:hypothetical protein
MILIWNDAKSFQRHINDMKVFRQSHESVSSGELSLFKNMPTPHDINYPCNTTGGRHLLKTGDITLVVPIWKIVLAQGLQN